jgi:hypothetical protein
MIETRRKKMRIKKRLLWIIGIVVCTLVVLTPNVFAQQKYAVLISAGQSTLDNQYLNSEYWYDLFLMYRMLIEDGFTHDNIYVLYGDGNDFNSVHVTYQTAAVFPGVLQITDYPNSKTNVANIFAWLGSGNVGQGIPQIQPGDFLFYWWMGHGNGVTCDDYWADIQNTGETVTDDEFAIYFSQLLACVIKTQYIMTCRSGGLVNDLEGLHSMVHTAAECTTNASSGAYDVVHADFSYHVASAFREQDMLGNPVLSDVNGDTLVSVEETNDYAHMSTTSSNTQIGDYRNIAPLIFIANAQPAAGVPTQGIYSRDYEEDYGAEPSDFMTYTWYEGPDLWVRHLQDGVTTHLEPEFGQTNYVYARVHNIGCDTVDATAELSWCVISAWSNPLSWNTIATAAVNNLVSGETRVINVPWSTVPAPGDYCMHTVLNAPGDPANASGEAFMDNNKVQINVEVFDNVPGWTKALHFLIENGISKQTKVDLVIEKLKFPAFKDAPPMTLKVPGGVTFDRLVGAEKTESDEGQLMVLSPHRQRAVIQGITLQPDEKKEAVLSVTMPEKLKLGQHLLIQVTEQRNGKDLGAVVFKLRAAKKKQVLSTLFGRISNVFDVMDKKFKLKGAKEIVGFSRQVKKGCLLDEENASGAMANVLELQSKTLEPLSKLMNKGEHFKFNKAFKAARKALKKGDIGLFVQLQEEMIFSTRSLFFRKMKKRRQE